jgi:UDP-N-acetyl-D-galactosamine dehydrogenase
MGFYVGKQCVKRMIEQGVNILESRVLVLGATFKENVSDIRNSKVVDVIRELESFSVNVDIVDPHADPEEMHEEYGVNIKSEPKGPYDAIVVAVNHKEFKDYNEAWFQSLMKPGKGVLIDIKGLYRGQINNLVYWSL